MQSILEELYMGNIEFDAGYYGQNSPFVKTARRKLDSMEKLNAMLGGTAKELFEQYCEAQGDIEGIIYRRPTVWHPAHGGGIHRYPHKHRRKGYG